MADPFFSLIVCTIGRRDPLLRLFSSLQQQTDQDFEVIVVDQNSDGRLDPVLSTFPNLPITRVRCTPGLSHARNTGLSFASGELIGFPDDDSWYPPALLGNIRRLYENGRLDGITTLVVDGEGRPIGARWVKQNTFINSTNAWRTAASAGIFLSRRIVASTGGFDEDLGIGAASGFESGEETDYLIRATHAGARILFVPELWVHHDNVPLKPRRGFRYGRGMGRVLRKHGCSVLGFTSYWIRPLGGCLLSAGICRFNRSAFHAAVLLGRVSGFVSRG